MCLHFDSLTVKVLGNESRKTLMEGLTDGGLYRLPVNLKGMNHEEVFLQKMTSFETWHSHVVSNLARDS